MDERGNRAACGNSVCPGYRARGDEGGSSVQAHLPKFSSGTALRPDLDVREAEYIRWERRLSSKNDVLAFRTERLKWIRSLKQS